MPSSNTIWGAYLGDLRTWGIGLAGAGIVVAAAARPRARARPALAAVPGALRGAALVAAGALLLADSELALDLAAAAGAGVLVYLGACRLLAGRARLGLAGAALASVATAWPSPRALRRPRRTPHRREAVPASGPARAARPPHARRAAADLLRLHERRARGGGGRGDPGGRGVKQLADGRVCVRAR